MRVHVGLVCAWVWHTFQIIVVTRDGFVLANAVECLALRSRSEPGGRVARHTFARPMLQRRNQRILQRVLGQLEIAVTADERGQHAAALIAEDLFDDRRIFQIKPDRKLV